WPPDQDIRPALAARIQIGVPGPAHLAAVTAAAGAAPGGCPDVHLKVDTGLGRNGATAAETGALFAAAAAAERAGRVRVVGIMSHLACADIPGDPSVAAQTDQFTAAITGAAAAGLRPRWRHL